MSVSRISILLAVGAKKNRVDAHVNANFYVIMERDMISLNMYTNVDINADMDMGRGDEYG
jgi:hypothetical protein